jgi:hypothetical protein
VLARVGQACAADQSNHAETVAGLGGVYVVVSEAGGSRARFWRGLADWVEAPVAATAGAVPGRSSIPSTPAREHPGTREVSAMQAVVGWHVEIEFEEDDTHTEAALLLRLPDGVELRGRGHAKRNPADEPQPRIGEEIAAARALSDLTHQLLDKAAGEISEVTHRTATITV